MAKQKDEKKKKKVSKEPKGIQKKTNQQNIQYKQRKNKIVCQKVLSRNHHGEIVANKSKKYSLKERKIFRKRRKLVKG